MRFEQLIVFATSAIPDEQDKPRDKESTAMEVNVVEDARAAPVNAR